MPPPNIYVHILYFNDLFTNFAKNLPKFYKKSSNFLVNLTHSVFILKNLLKFFKNLNKAQNYVESTRLPKKMGFYRVGGGGEFAFGRIHGFLVLGMQDKKFTQLKIVQTGHVAYQTKAYCLSFSFL